MSKLSAYPPSGEPARLERFGADFLRGFAMRPILGTIKAQIPGANKDDIKAAIDGNRVSISAEVKKEKENKQGKKVVRRERYFGSVSRSLTLGQAKNEQMALAKYQWCADARVAPKARHQWQVAADRLVRAASASR